MMVGNALKQRQVLTPWLPSWHLCSGDIPDPSPVLAPVGGGAQVVHSCHHDGWGPQIRCSHLHRARKPDAGEETAFVLITSEDWFFAGQDVTALVLFTKAPRRGRGGPTWASQRLPGCHRKDIPSVSEGGVLVLCPDVGTTCDLDLQPGFWHHQHLLGVMERLWGEKEHEEKRKVGAQMRKQEVKTIWGAIIWWLVSCSSGFIFKSERGLLFFIIIYYFFLCLAIFSFWEALW